MVAHSQNGHHTVVSKIQTGKTKRIQYAAALSTSVNVIMTLLKRGLLANMGAQATEAPQTHQTHRSQIYKQVIVLAHNASVIVMDLIAWFKIRMKVG